MKITELISLRAVYVIRALYLHWIYCNFVENVNRFRRVCVKIMKTYIKWLYLVQYICDTYEQNDNNHMRTTYFNNIVFECMRNAHVSVVE